MLDDHWDSLEADFERTYQRDLEDAIEEMGPRKIYNLVRWLPEDAALWRSMRPDPEPKTKVDEVKSVLADVGVPVVVG